MKASVPRTASRRWLVYALIGAGMLLFVGANAHLVYVAVASQPACVPHAKGAGENYEYRAARSAC